MVIAKKVLTKEALLLLLSYTIYINTNIEYKGIREELEKIGDDLYFKYLKEER